MGGPDHDLAFPAEKLIYLNQDPRFLPVALPEPPRP
jgi:hypothetical protein